MVEIKADVLIVESPTEMESYFYKQDLHNFQRDNRTIIIYCIIF